MIKSYKIRLLPTPEQEQLLWKHAGAARFIWNWALDYQQRWYELGERHLSAYDMIYNLPKIKKLEEYAWLKEVSNSMLVTIMLDLEKTYQGFFKRGNGFPKFKTKKRSIPKFPICPSRFYIRDCTAQIQKLGKVKFQTNYTIPEKTKYVNPRIKYVNGKWMLSFGIECETQARELTDKTIGVDLGIKKLAVASHGDECIEFNNINKSKRVRNLEHKLKHLQRNLSRKYRTNGNYEKTNAVVKLDAQIAEIYYKLSNIRKNYIHQTTHKLVELLPKKVVMEDLNIAGMMKNRHLSKAIANQCLFEFIRQMRYKCEWNGIEFVQADRFFPSSKTCSECGVIKKDLKLKDRTYVCNECFLEIDRDYNAAINLARYTDKLETAVA
jgi:putative transposase